MRLRYHVLDVFTDRAFGGNPLAVVFGGDTLSSQLMQTVAAEFNLSETVFVLPPRDSRATRRVRIFTPRIELPFAGHPTVGTAFLLATLGECDLSVPEPVVVLEEGVGDVHVRIQVHAGEPIGAQMSVPRMPEPGPAPPTAPALAKMLSLTADELDPDIAPQTWSCGLPFLFIALKSVAAVERAAVRLDLSVELMRGYPAQNFFVFAFGGVAPDADIHARMFAPAFGIAEDPATGAAVAALAGCLARTLPDGRYRWMVEQGIEMKRPSRLALECEKAAGRISAVRVGGLAVRIAAGVLKVQ
jgi:trans-2,3-dihydro-3-hydroxyanthranilate isomerase